MSIQNTSNEIKSLEPEIVSYDGAGEVRHESFFTKYFWLLVVILVLGMVWGTKILVNLDKPNVTIEMGQK